MAKAKAALGRYYLNLGAGYFVTALYQSKTDEPEAHQNRSRGTVRNADPCIIARITSGGMGQCDHVDQTVRSRRVEVGGRRTAEGITGVGLVNQNDRRWGIVTSPKAQRSAIRQSATNCGENRTGAGAEVSVRIFDIQSA